MKPTALHALTLVCWACQLHATASGLPNDPAAGRLGTPQVSIPSEVVGADRLSASLSVSDTGSDGGGATHVVVPVSSFSGEVGISAVIGGGKRIAGNAGKDWPGKLAANLPLPAAVQAAPPAPDGMVLVPAGSFIMGDTLGDGWVNERPTHTVSVSAFYLDRNEVRQALWDEVYQWAVGHDYRFDNPGLGKAENHPVHTVNWYDVVKWCNARSEKEGRVPAYYTDAAHTAVYRTGQVAVQNDWVKWTAGYRLPTEAEWERAARGGSSGRRFPWGDTISHSQANYNSSSYYTYDISPTRGFDPSYSFGGFPYTSPVGLFPPNGYGLYDMVGNVWDWCWDWYGDYGSGLQTDPRGPLSGTGRVVRGGSWNTFAWYCRIANRDYYAPALRDYDYGFRCALPPASGNQGASKSGAS